VFKNPVLGDNGVYADLHFLKSHPLAARVCEAAERMPEVLGFSQNATTIQVPDGHGGVVHESIKRVRSVDLVADPATTQSIFESYEEEQMNNPHTEGAPGSPDLGLVNEEGMGGPPAGEGGIENNPVDITIDALLEQYIPQIKTADKATRKTLLESVKKKIDGVLELLAGEEETPAAPPEAGMEQEEEPPKEGLKEKTATEQEEPPKKLSEEKTMEQEGLPKKPKEGAATEQEEPPKKLKEAPTYESAIDVLESEGVEVTNIRVKTLLRSPKGEWKDVISTWPKRSSSTPPRPKSGSVMEAYREQETQLGDSVGLTEEQIKDDASRLMGGSRLML
jgi:hypothetical protein